MKKQFIILISILAFFVSSCQEDNTMGNPLELTSGEVPVKVSFSLDDLLETGSEVVPMNSNGDTRAEEQVKVQMTNGIKVLLAKEVNGKWILDQMFLHTFAGGNSWDRIDITESYVFKPIQMILRPGKYKVVLITGNASMNWNPNLAIGMLLPEDGSAPWASMYTTAQRELNEGLPTLEEEIFSGSKEFEVKKTEDVHSAVKDNNVSLTLNRKVARLRILLKKRTTGDVNLDFQTGVINGIVAKLEPIDSNVKFSGGLNVWGEHQYEHYRDPVDETTLYFGVFTKGKYCTGNDGYEYMLGQRNQRQCGQYFFIETGQEIPVRIKEIEVSGDTYFPAYIYPGTIESKIKHNTITGVIFESGDTEWDSEPRNYRYLLLVEENGAPAKPETKFHNYYEYVN